MAEQEDCSVTYNEYPPAEATYSQVVANVPTFLTTLLKLHRVMRMKYMVPMIGGVPVDLHKLFVAVTNKGGITKLHGDRKGWKEVREEVREGFNFHPSAYRLEKSYISALKHYENVYYHRATGWIASRGQALVTPVFASGGDAPTLVGSFTKVIEARTKSGCVVNLVIDDHEPEEGVLYLLSQPHSSS